MEFLKQTQFVALLELKCRLNYRRLRADLPSWLPPEAVLAVFFVLGLLAALFGYAFTIYLPEAMVLEVLGLGLNAIWFAMLFGPLIGSRLGESLDFRSLLVFPASPRALFVSSCLLACLDAPVLGNLPVLWGISLGLSVSLDWSLFPLGFVILFLWMLQTLAISQTILFLYYTLLRNSRWFGFVMTFVVPLGSFLVLILLYGQLLLRVPLLEPFARPDFPFLANTWFLPPSTALLAIRGLIEHNWVGLLYFALLLLQTLLAFLVGGAVVQFVQQVEEIEGRRVSVLARKCYEWLENLLRFIPYLSSEVRVMVMKDLRIYLREPSVRMILLLPVLTSAIFWAVAVVVADLRGWSFPVAEFWPLFLFGALFLSASDLSCNLFGMERQALVQLLNLPVVEEKIILAKNIALLVFFAMASLLVLVVAVVSGSLTLHALQGLWFSLILLLLVLFPGGNLLSVTFPMRIEALASRALQREGFGRVIIVLLFRLILALINTFLTLPVIVVCILPLGTNPLVYLTPLQNDWTLLRQILLTGPEHLLFLGYALGAYVLTLPYIAKVMRKRREDMVRVLAA